MTSTAQLGEDIEPSCTVPAAPEGAASTAAGSRTSRALMGSNAGGLPLEPRAGRDAGVGTALAPLPRSFSGLDAASASIISASRLIETEWALQLQPCDRQVHQ